MAEEGDLTGAERAARDYAPGWFAMLEGARGDRRLDLVLLLTALDTEGLWASTSIDELSARTHEVVARTPDLAQELRDDTGLGPDPLNPTPEARSGYWRGRVAAAWTGADGAHPWFEATHGRLRFRKVRPTDPHVQAAFGALSREFVDARLAELRRLRLADAPGSAFRGKLIRATFYVTFAHSGEGWSVAPVCVAPSTGSRRGLLITFPSLKAAAGFDAASTYGVPDGVRVQFPPELDGENRFAVRASGTSMDGGRNPIRDGDWVVMRWARSASAAAVDGRVALVATGDPDVGEAYHIKRLRKRDGQWWLESDNNAVGPAPARPDMQVVALYVTTVRQEVVQALEDDVAS